MTVETFLANFGHLANAPNGVRKLRELILQLAVQGKLVPQDPKDEPAVELLKRIQAEKARLVKEKKIRKSDPLPPVTGDEVTRGLPTGWQWGRIGSVVLEITGGGTPSKQNPRYWGGNIPWASVKDLGKSKFLESTIDHITELGLKESSSNLIPVGRVIVCTRMGLGKIAINRIATAINQDLKALTISEHIDINYFYNLYGTLDIKGSGMTVSGIKQEALLSMPIPLPPLAEQRRIVAKVDQLMVLCDELEARQQKQQDGRVRLNNAALDALLNAGDPADFATHWQRVCTNFDLLYDHPDTIAKLRAAILQLAVQGKLVPHRSSPDYHSLGSILSEASVNGVSKGPTSDTRATEILRISAGTSRGDFYVDENDFKHVELSEDEIEKYKLLPGDLLACRFNGNLHFVGRFSYYRGETGRVQVNPDKLIRFRINARNSSRYVCYVMNSATIRESIEALCSTTAGNIGLSAGKLKLVKIPLPPLVVQHQIVAKVDHLMTLCDALEAKLNQARQQSEKLMEASVRQLLVA